MALLLPLDLKTRLELIVAHDSLCQVDSTELAAVANAILNRGIYSDCLVRLIDARPCIRSEVDQPFATLCEEVGLSNPNKDWAVWTILKNYMPRIADQKNNPVDEFIRFVSEIGGPDYFQSCKRFQIGDSHAIEDLFHLDMLYEWNLTDPDLKSDNRAPVLSRLETLKLEMRNVARKWLEDQTNHRKTLDITNQ